VPEQPPPFRPFTAVPGADAPANAMAFLEWVADGIWRIHMLSEANYRYSRSIYEAMARSQGQGPISPPAHQVNRDQLGNVLFQVGKVAAQNRAAIAQFLREFMRR
jgi:hypothetical protein